MARLRGAVDDAASGRARFILIAGEPGIGKTALAEATAAYATSSGAVALWGPCWEGDGAPAYWPWVQIIRSYARGRQTGDLLADMREGAADIALLVPEVAGRFLVLTNDDETDPERARFRLFDHVAGFLRSAAERQPLLLVLDDLHWADRSSLTLLGFIARVLRDAPLLVLGTYRDIEVTADHPLAQTVGEMTRERISLGGLGRAEVASLVRLTTGMEPQTGLADAVFGRTTGNPFFVKEVAQLLAAQGRLDQDARAAAFAIPEGVSDVVRRRLARLSQDCVDMLVHASVIGPEFGVEMVAKLLGRAPTELLPLADLAVSARIVGEVPGPTGKYAFVHALVREVIYDGLGAARRSELHWRAGELLEQRHAGALDAHLAEIANHLLKGAAAGDPSKAADTAIRAARLAIRMYAWDQASDLYARALDVLAMAGTDDALQVRTMLELGDARTRAGDLTGARTVFDAAADLAQRLGLASELAHAALGFGSGLGGLEVQLFDERQIELLNRALTLLPAEDSAVRAWVMARLSVASRYVRPLNERADLSRKAVAMARRLGDRGSLSYALSSLCDALAGPDDIDERILASTEMIDLSAEPATGTARCGVESCTVCLCDPEFALLGRRLRLVARLESGAIDAFVEDMEAYARLAEHLRQPLYLWYVPLFRGMHALMHGSLYATERFLDEADSIATRTSSDNIEILTAMLRVGLTFERGESGETVRIWRSLTDRGHALRMPSSSGLSIWLTAMAGDPKRAVPMLQRWSAEGGLRDQPKDAEWLSSAANFADTALMAQEPESIRDIYEQLLPYEDMFVVEGIAARFMGSVAHYLGRLASFMRRFDVAERHFEKAVAAHAATRAVLWLARSRLEYARMLAASDDSRLALRGSLARAAAETFTEFGLAHDAAKASAIAEGTPAPEAPGDNVFRLEGEFWTVAFGGAVARLKDSKGLRDIAALLASPGREIAALDLYAQRVVSSARADTEQGIEGDAGEVLDERARAAYRARIGELQSEIEEAERDDDTGRAAKARYELDAITAQLAGAYGLGGRPRKAGDPAERARKAVTERIRDALMKFAREHPAVHRHLKSSLRTGTFCSYEPEHPVTWSF